MDQSKRKIILLTITVFSCLIGVTNGAYAAMSIDLGTQSIKIGLVKPGVPMEIVLNKESKRKTPFAIGIKNDTRYFGEAAVQYSMKNPKGVFFSFLDLIGKKIDNPIVTKYQKENPHLTIIGDEKRETVVFEMEDGSKYAVETLLAMVLQNIRDLCKAYANQLVKDVVITIPPYFNQAERKSIAAAAEIAGLNVLQFLTEGSAIGLNYGVFRYKTITEKPQILLIYDVGFSKTICTIVEFRLTKEKHPIVSTIGIGYDRTIGGNELTLRLRSHLVDEFNKLYKPIKDITKDPKAMAKLYKEAERVKTVLSANNDHYAHIENLFDNKDFRVKVTRQQFQELFADVESNFFKPIENALKMAELEINHIDLIVLMGAGSRVPRLQQLLQEYFGSKEIGRFLNTDESITMGALYQSAHLSNGFKVKKFGIQELQIFPVRVVFTPNSASQEQQSILYAYRSIYPAPTKAISFKSYVDDFNFYLNYAALDHLSSKQLMEFGSLSLSKIFLKGLGEVIKQKVTENTIFKGVKVHFEMNQLGVVEAKQAEALLETKNSINSTFSAIADKIGSFFSGSSSTETKNTDFNENIQNENVENSTNATQNSTEKNEKEKEKVAEQTTEKKTSNSTEEKEKKNDEVLSKPKIVKIPLKLEEISEFKSLTSEEIKEETKILINFETLEKKRLERDDALNSLERNIYDTYENLENTDYTRFGTENELNNLTASIKSLKTWLDEDVDANTPTEEITEKETNLNKLLKQIKYRKHQFEKRDPLVEELEKVLEKANNSAILEFKTFLVESDITAFNKLIAETKIWLHEKKEDQNKLQFNEDPILKVADLKEKIIAVEREVKYLTGKLWAQKYKIEQSLKKAKEEDEAEEAKKKAEAKEGVDDAKKNSTEQTDGKETLKDEEPTLKETNFENDSKQNEKDTENVLHDQTEL